MADVTLFKQDATEAGKAVLKDSVFSNEINQDVLHQSVVSYMANQRQGTRAVKHRSEVAGGGKKPWKQKHTGRARQGSIRAVQWKGGGVAHGPQPRDFGFRLNKKVRHCALRSALSLKSGEGGLTVLDSFSVAKIRTKAVLEFLKSFKAEDSKVVLVSSRLDEAVKLSVRNLPKVWAVNPSGLHPYHLLWADKVFITKDALAKIEEALA
ncbi:MAG: 50S ribosomal protein L4 [bacterium]